MKLLKGVSRSGMPDFLRLTIRPTAVDKAYDRILRHRQRLLAEELSPKQAIHSTLITTYGLKYNEYSGDFVNVVTLDELFK